ncbi:hypothetical protein E8E14_004234 [Neopestalotiopsis sp. 37M]|nr:hypothetical protein E8E14_004234 [Neopestalotiopsis sp. 37M]
MAKLYEPLPARTIRLLRLLPGDSGEVPIQCELLLLPLPENASQLHLYEALSYVWGSEDTPNSIIVSGQTVHIGANLYHALLRLRHHLIHRVLWIDAICINQTDTREKEQQIPLMSQIYHQAGRVIVWLGEEADDSTEALQAILQAGKSGSDSNELFGRQPFPSMQELNTSGSAYAQDSDSEDQGLNDRETSSENGETCCQDGLEDYRLDGSSEDSVFAVLSRPWFHRIWVPQEVSSSRYTLIMCGLAEINGYAFCQGVLALVQLLRRRQDIFGCVMPVVRLMTASTLGPTHTNLRPLEELVDMYHTRESAIRHDMLYALRGLSSDDFEDIGLSIDYSGEWNIVFHKLLRFLFPIALSLHISADGTCAGFQHAAKLVSKVVTLKSSTTRGGYQIAETESASRQGFLPEREPLGGFRKGGRRGIRSRQTWYLPNSANPVQVGDFICLLEGSESHRSAVVRAQGAYFELIAIAAYWQDRGAHKKLSKEWLHLANDVKGFTVLPFVWDWQNHAKVERTANHQKVLQTVLDLRHLGNPKDVSIAYLKRVSIVSNAISSILRLEEPHPKLVEDARLESYEAYNKAYSISPDNKNKVIVSTHGASRPACGKRHSFMQHLCGPRCSGLEVSLPLLSWATLNGYDQLVRDLVRDGAAVNVTDYIGRGVLSCAAQCGNIDLAQFLLDNGAHHGAKTALIESLSFALFEGPCDPITQHLIFLLDTSEHKQDQILHHAIVSDDIDMVRCFLSCGFDVNSGKLDQVPPLREIQENMNLDMYGMYSRMDRFWSDLYTGDTLLLIAIKRSNERMARLFVEQGADLQYKGRYVHEMPLIYSVRHGKENMVRLLLDLGAEADWRGEDGKNSLHHLAETEGGKSASAVAIARILLDCGSDVNAVDHHRGQTPLMRALVSESLDLASFLIREGADVNRQCMKLKTSLAYAVQPGRKRPPLKGCIQLLLDHGAKFEAAPWFYSKAKKKGMTPEQMWPDIWPKTGRADEPPFRS